MDDTKEQSVSECQVPKDALGDVKVGDTFKVSSISDDSVGLEPMESAPKMMSDEEMAKMPESDAMKMPLGKLEASLPKANREE